MKRNIDFYNVPLLIHADVGDLTTQKIKITASSNNPLLIFLIAAVGAGVLMHSLVELNVITADIFETPEQRRSGK